MKTLFKLICIIVLSLSVNSCGVNWQMNSSHTNYIDENYQTDWNSDEWYSPLPQNNFFLYNSPYSYWGNWSLNSPYRWSLFGYDRWGYNNYLWYGWNSYPWYGNWNSNYWWNYQYPLYGNSYFYGLRPSSLGNFRSRRGRTNTTRPTTPKPRSPQTPKPTRIQPQNHTIPTTAPRPTRPTYQQPQRPQNPVRTRPQTQPRQTPIRTRPQAQPRPQSTPRSNSKRGGQ